MKSVNMQLGDGNDSVEITIDGKVNSFYLTHEELKAAEALLTISDQ